MCSLPPAVHLATPHPVPKGDDKLKLGGGLALKTPFGTFYAPNISSDKERGIGGWSVAQFVDAVMRGVAPDGRHYYPSFPYMSYQRMKIADVVDLKAFMDTLPAVANVAPPHDLPPPFRIRRGLGLWKLLFMDYEPFKPIAGASEEVNRGAYLVTGPGHCGECHTPRNIIGGPDYRSRDGRWPGPGGRRYGTKHYPAQGWYRVMVERGYRDRLGNRTAARLRHPWWFNDAGTGEHGAADRPRPLPRLPLI